MCTELINNESATPVHAQHVKTATVNTDWYIGPVYGLSMIECRGVGVGPFNLGSSSGGQPCQHRLSVPHVQQNLFEESEAHFQDSNSIVNPCRLSHSTVCTIHIYRGRSTNTCRGQHPHRTTILLFAGTEPK